MAKPDVSYLDVVYFETVCDRCVRNVRLYIFKNRILGLSESEEMMTLAFYVVIQYRSVTDGQTDGHLFSGYTSACIACYGFVTEE